MKRVLLLGADGFIGRHIALELQSNGVEVLAVARRSSALESMGIKALNVDLTDPVCHDPEFWRGHLIDGKAIVNAAGLLTGSEAAFYAVHVAAPRAIYAARDPGAPALLLSAIGIEADTPFGRWRREGEAVAAEADVTILRPGLVLGETSYGGSSLLRSLAAMPFLTPVIGDGTRQINPIHAGDLAKIVTRCLTTPPGPGAWEIGGPERLSQTELTQLYRGWMGLPAAPVLRLPLPVARALGRIGDMLKLGPVSATSVAQFSQGLEADETGLAAKLGVTPRGVTEFVKSRPAGTQDIWQARLYLLKPILRLTLALLWLISGILGLTLAPDTFLPMTPGGAEGVWIALARIGGLADLAIAAALIRNWRPGLMALIQAAMVGGYTVVFTILDPGLWALPLGGLLKNIPILALIAVWAVLERER